MENRSESEKHKPKKKRLIVESRSAESVAYHLTKVYCGNQRCKSCPHGLYWYAYYREGNRVVSKYVGKKFRFIEKP